MRRTTRALALVAILTSGCSLVKLNTDTLGKRERDGSTSAAGSSEPTPTGALVVPRRNAIRIVTLERSLRDPLVDLAVWEVADEQVLDPDLRRSLEANGLRLGVINGSLPAELEAVINAPPPNKIDPTVVTQSDGENTLYALHSGEPPERLTLFLNRGAGATGKDYSNPRGFFRITSNQEADSQALRLRLVPELHHGESKRQIGADPNAGPYDPLQFVMREAQQEDSLRDLMAEVVLRPDQVLVLGCDSTRARSLGHFLMTRAEPESDRLLQRVVLIWAQPVLGSTIPWMDAITPPSNLVPVDPPETPLAPAADAGSTRAERRRRRAAEKAATSVIAAEPVETEE